MRRLPPTGEGVAPVEIVTHLMRSISRVTIFFPTIGIGS